MKSTPEAKLSVFQDAWTVHQMLEGKKHRKFNDVFIVKHKVSGMLGICKHLKKTDQNRHLWPLLQQEASFSFTEKGLPQTLAFEENDNEIVLIRDFKQGIPLDVFWKQIPKRQQRDFTVKLIEKLVPIFHVLKEKGIVHGDIKPTNILVSGTANDPEISLIDFGMAFSMHEPPQRKTLFALGYSAPELILNQLNLVNHTTDIFALGISIWQLFAGKLPLMHPNPGIMTNLQITHPLPESRSIPKDIFVVLERMCLKHSFRKPPNQMDEEVVQQCLKDAMGRRFGDLEAVFLALSQPRERSWIERLWK